MVKHETSLSDPPQGKVRATVVDGPDFNGTYTDEILLFIGLHYSEYRDIIPLTEEVVSCVIRAAGTPKVSGAKNK
jgi:hypothetical protein